MLQQIVVKKKGISDCPEIDRVKELVKGLLDQDPIKRPTIEEALKEISSIKSVGNELVDFAPYMELLKVKALSDP